VDYTFGQVAVDAPQVDYSANCGNLSSAVGPFAVDEGLVAAANGEGVVRIHNTNTHKVIVSRFPMAGEVAAVDGDFELAGVAGTWARVRLEFLDPGGAVTGRLLPTGELLETLNIPGLGDVEASLVDAATPVVFVAATALGVTGTESPDDLEADAVLLTRLEAIRGEAAVRMGLAKTPEDAARNSKGVPKVAMVAPPLDGVTLTGEPLPEGTMDITVRMISMGRPHRAVPLTGALCAAVAARLEGSLVHRLARQGGDPAADLRIAQPSGIIPLAAAVSRDPHWHAAHAVVYRSARRLMEGHVLVPASRLARPIAGTHPV
jgi:hypothetical protein